MRNLQVLSLFETKIPVNGSISHFTIGAESNDIFFVTTTNILYGYHPSDNKIWLELHLEQGELLPQDSKIIGLEYIPDLEAVCLATRGGEIISYEISLNEVSTKNFHYLIEQAECVGVVDSGITAMGWSPDNELVVFNNGSPDHFINDQELGRFGRSSTSKQTRRIFNFSRDLAFYKLERGWSIICVQCY